jgi:hypothetical protein
MKRIDFVMEQAKPESGKKHCSFSVMRRMRRTVERMSPTLQTVLAEMVYCDVQSKIFNMFNHLLRTRPRVELSPQSKLAPGKLSFLPKSIWEI